LHSLTVRPRAGSKDIDLSLCTLSVLYDNLSLCTLSVLYDNLTIVVLNESLIEAVNTDNASVFHTPIESGWNHTIMDNSTSSEFGVIAIHDPDTSITRTSGMNSGETVSGILTPEIGIKSQYDVTAPAVFSKRIVGLD